MHQLMYIMQCKGYTAPVGASPHVFQVITIASSCTINSHWGRRRAWHPTVDRRWQGGLPVLCGFAWLCQQANAVENVAHASGRKRANLLAHLGFVHRENL